MTTKAYRTWMARLDSGVLTKSQIQQFAAAISTVANGWDASGRHSALTGDERVKLYRRARSSPVRLTDEQTTKALDWLTRYGSRSQASGGLGMSKYLLGIVIEHFSHFTFDGEYVVDGRNVWPVWTVHLKKDVRLSNLVRDDRLHYYAVPWQARTSEVYSDYWFPSERG